MILPPPFIIGDLPWDLAEAELVKKSHHAYRILFSFIFLYFPFGYHGRHHLKDLRYNSGNQHVTVWQDFGTRTGREGGMDG